MFIFVFNINIINFIIKVKQIFAAMGNTAQQQQNSPNKQKRQTRHRYIMALRQRQIIIDYTQKVKIMIKDLSLFPNDYQGLHLFDSNVILARYIYKNRAMFKSKEVIEFLSGTGLASIVLKKYCEASKIATTDRHSQVIKNIIENCKINQIKQGMVIAQLRWSEYENYKTKFDFVLGADLLFKECPVETLLKALSKLLKVGGTALLVVPQRKGNDKSEQFIKSIDQNQFQLKKEEIVDQYYLESPLLNKVQGYQDFKQISQGKFYLYKLTKILESQEIVSSGEAIQGKQLKNQMVEEQQIVTKKSKAQRQKDKIQKQEQFITPKKKQKSDQGQQQIKPKEQQIDKKQEHKVQNKQSEEEQKQQQPIQNSNQKNKQQKPKEQQSKNQQQIQNKSQHSQT